MGIRFRDTLRENIFCVRGKSLKYIALLPFSVVNTVFIAFYRDKNNRRVGLFLNCGSNRRSCRGFKRSD